MFFVALGWVATASYLIGHIYMSLQPEFKARIYYSLNLIGAVGFIISSGVISSWQSVIINVFWALISVAALRGASKLPFFPLSRWVLLGPTFLAALISGIIMVANTVLGANILGWAGTLLYIIGYYLFASETVKKWQFLIYNTIAALILLPVYYLDGNWPAFGLSVVWSVISLFGLWAVRTEIGFKRPTD